MHYLLDSVEQGGLGLRRCQWKAHSLNTKSQVAAIRMGFEYEGLIKAFVVMPKGKEGVAGTCLNPARLISQMDDPGVMPTASSVILGLRALLGKIGRMESASRSTNSWLGDHNDSLSLHECRHVIDAIDVIDETMSPCHIILSWTCWTIHPCRPCMYCTPSHWDAMHSNPPRQSLSFATQIKSQQNCLRC